MATAETPNDSSQPSVTTQILCGCLLAWIGVLICFLLLSRQAAAMLCQARLGCETVLASPYSAILGVPLPWVGAAFYVGMLAVFLLALGTASPTRRLRVLNGALWLSLGAASFSGMLMGVQFIVLRAFCPLCTASAAVVGTLAFTAWRAAGRAERSTEVGSKATAMVLAAFAVFTAAAMGLAVVATPSSPAMGPRRLDIDLATARVSGPRNATVQLVVFSDFQCQFCAQLAPVLKRVREEFSTEVLVAYRYFPLEVHPRAIPAAIAAECAGELDAFWEYHDRIFAEGEDLREARLIEIAVSLKLEEGRFRECLNSGRAKAVVDASQRDAVKSGLEAAPALFLDGNLIGGVVTYDALAAQISQKIQAARARSSRPLP